MNLILKHKRKLFQLYGDRVPLIKEKNNVLNISKIEVNDNIKEILQLGLNCHLKTRSTNNDKKIENEKLFYSIENLVTRKELEIEEINNFRSELKLFGANNSIDYTKDVINKEHYKLLKELKNNDENITIRRADKSNTVVMNKLDYNQRLTKSWKTEIDFKR